MNNNIEENRVDFPNGKLLKEKDYRMDCDQLFRENGDIRLHIGNVNGLDDDDYTSYSRPTTAIVISWLRENFNIEISAQVNFFNKSKKLGYYYTIDRFNEDNIHDGKDYDMTQINLIGDKKAFDTPEEAENAAIFYTLNTLI